MLFSKKMNLIDGIVSILIINGPLAAKQLYTTVNKDVGGYSIQAIYKKLKSSLNINENSLLPGFTKKTSYQENNLIELNIIWKDAIHTLKELFPKNIMFAYVHYYQ